MTSPQCPNCQGATRLAGNQRYCPSCGWNRDAAIATLRGNLKMMPFGVVVFVGFVAFMVRGWHFRNPTQIAIFAGVPAIGILLNYIYARKNLATLEAMPGSSARPRVASDGPAFGSTGREAGGDTDSNLQLRPAQSIKRYCAHRARARFACRRRGNSALSRGC